MTTMHAILLLLALSLNANIIKGNSCIESFAEEYKKGLIACPHTTPLAYIFCEHALQFLQPIADSLKAKPTRNR